MKVSALNVFLLYKKVLICAKKVSVFGGFFTLQLVISVCSDPLLCRQNYKPCTPATLLPSCQRLKGSVLGYDCSQSKTSIYVVGMQSTRKAHMCTVITNLQNLLYKLEAAIFVFIDFHLLSSIKLHNHLLIKLIKRTQYQLLIIKGMLVLLNILLTFASDNIDCFLINRTSKKVNIVCRFEWRHTG